MFDTFLIETEFPNLKKEYFLSDIHVRAVDNIIVFYVKNEHVSEVVKTGYVSKKQLESLAKIISEKYKTGVEIIYIQSDKLEKLEQGIKLLLSAKFANIIEDANFTFIRSENVNAWLKVKDLDDAQKENIKSYLLSIFKDSGIKNLEIQWVEESDKLPSIMEILILTKKLQPILLDKYISEFRATYQSIHIKWLNSQLDKLIKMNLVIRDKEKAEYALTIKGLSVIPNIQGRANYDIARALALGRKKW